MKIGDVLNHKHGGSSRKRFWMGELPTNCQICHVALTQTFVDGKTRFGPWAIMCAGCHRDQRFGLGTGMGQRYDAKTGEMLNA